MDQPLANNDTLARIFREDAGGILAVLIHQFRDFDLAEEALQDAMSEALTIWRREGVPRNGPGWLVTTARRRAIDRMRRAIHTRDANKQREWLLRMESDEDANEGEQPIPDERLRLIFTCCHPALAPEARVALTLRTLCGLTTAQIARAFLVPEATMAQRLVRAKNKIRDAGIAYEVPGEGQWNERLEEVLDVIYLIFNEGFAASDGEHATRADLTLEAIRLGKILWQLAPRPEAGGLLALMLLHDARRSARETSGGAYVPMTEQDRSRWNAPQMQQGRELLLHCLAQNRPGPFQIQAAISAVHSEAASAAQTDWRQIAGLYAALERITPSPVVALNRAVAIANAGDLASALEIVQAIADELPDYQPFHAAHADLLARSRQKQQAAVAYRKAMEMSGNVAERAFLQARLAALLNAPV